MPHHYERPNPHTRSGSSERTPVSKAAVMRTKKLDPLSFEERRGLEYKKLPPKKGVPPSLQFAANTLDKITGGAKKNWD
jgi:hypothetical protein